MTAGANPMSLKRGIDQAVAAVTEKLVEMSREVNGKEEIAHVATISSQDSEIGGMIADAFDKVGKDGVISVEESSTTAMEMDFTEGMQFDKGYISPYFVTDADRMEAVLEDARILLVQGKIAAVNEILPLLEKVVEAGKPLLIIAEDVEGEALSSGRQPDPRHVYLLRSEGSALAIAEGDLAGHRDLDRSPVVSPEVGLKLDQVGLDVLGSARRIVVTKDNTTIVTMVATLARWKIAYPDQARDRCVRFRLGSREVARAACETCRWCRCHPCRRPHRGGVEGEEASHRRRRFCYPCRDRRRHCLRWRNRAGSSGVGSRR